MLFEDYSLPNHILQTDLHPDIVWWDSTSIMLVELTIPFEMFLHEAHERKEAKYYHLVEEAWEKGFQASLITLEVGCRGIPNLTGFQKLKDALKLPTKVFTELLQDAIKATIGGSFSVWVNRNKLN